MSRVEIALLVYVVNLNEKFKFTYLLHKNQDAAFFCKNQPKAVQSPNPDINKILQGKFLILKSFQ